MGFFEFEWKRTMDTLRPKRLRKAINDVAEINDVPALEKALAPGDVACVLVEPALTDRLRADRLT